MCQRQHLYMYIAQDRGVLKERDFFFFVLRTALKDSPKGPPTANRQLPSTANRHQPPTTNRHQPPATNRRQPPAATNRQLPTTANCLQPPTASHQPPPTTTNRHQPPVANCQPPTAANRQPPTATTMVEHMECPRALLKLPGSGRDFFSFFCVKDSPGSRTLAPFAHLSGDNPSLRGPRGAVKTSCPSQHLLEVR